MSFWGCTPSLRFRDDSGQGEQELIANRWLHRCERLRVNFRLDLIPALASGLVIKNAANMRRNVTNGIGPAYPRRGYSSGHLHIHFPPAVFANLLGIWLRQRRR